jgi:hypothetical protein
MFYPGSLFFVEGLFVMKWTPCSDLTLRFHSRLPWGL